MPKNVMKLIKPNPHHSRNDFDLSHRHCYTMNFGELLPVSFVETVPGDHIRFDIANLCRAMPLVTSPFLRAKQHFDVWFVAYKDLWHNFDSFITQRYDPVSSAFQSHLYCPHMNFGQMKTDFAAIGLKVDVADRPLIKGVEKLWKLCGYGKMSLPATAGDNNFSVNPFRILAYNYIWYNEYRNKYYDDGSLHVPAGVYNNAQLFNCDALPCSTNSNSELRGTFGAGYYNAIFQMRYRQWKKDLYTGQLPSTQFGAVSSLTSQNLNSRLAFVDINNQSVGQNRVLSTASGGLLDVSTSATDGSVPNQWSYMNAYLKAGSLTSSVDILSLRKATALQVWRENALRAGNRVEDNMRAHYGVDSDFRDHRPTYLGSVDAPLNIGDIDATAQTGSGTNQALGSIVGKGLSSLSNKVFEFDAKDFGVIVVLHSILPEAEYNASGVDRMNQLLESEDFFTSEFENLGLEGVPLSTFYHVSSSGGSIMGYAPRYYGYKTKLDKCFGALETGGSLSPWCSPRADVDQILAQVPTAYPLRNLYVDPSLFDNNFQVSIANSDQFIVDTYFDVDAVRPMSVMGLPLE